MSRSRSLRRRVWTGVGGALAVVLAGGLVVAGATVATTVRRPFPQREGEVRLAGLDAGVEVRRDARGVPHVYADTTADLFRAQGYVAAQERFFEMDLRRHIAAGRLSELVGENPDALTADRVVRTLGWRRTAERELRTLSPESRDVLRAYAEGVNAYLEGRSPSAVSVSYSVLGLQVPIEPIEPWTPADSLSWLKAVAWDLSANRGEELARGALLAAGIPRERVDELRPGYPEGHPAIVDAALAPLTPAATGPAAPAAPAAPAQPPGDAARGAPAAGSGGPGMPAAAAGALRAAALATAAVPQAVGAGDAVGSNSWVVSGAYTASGGPLLANDPHLAPSVPSVWSQVGLHCREVTERCPYDVAGFSFAAVPGVLIGHNQRIAWGLTTLYADVTDHYLEHVVDGEYLVGGERVPLDVRREVIRVAGGKDVDLVVRSTRHGPLLSDVLDTDAEVGAGMPRPAGGPPRGQGYALAIAWTGLEPARTMDALVAINAAQDWAAFRAAAAVFDIPSQNLVYADVDGHIGYQTPGRIPVRGAGDGLVPAPGWDPAYDWQGWVDPAALPSVLDPPSGLVVTANNAVTRDPAAPYLGADTDRGWRAQRLDELLRPLLAEAAGRPAGQGLAAEDMSRLQADARSPLADLLVPHLLDVEGLDAFTLEAVDVLRGWDGQDAADSAGAAYANAVWRHVLARTFHDELPEDLRPTGGDVDLAAVARLLDDPGNAWWDDVATAGVVEGRDVVLADALVEARLELTGRLAKDPDRWRWGRLHVLSPTQTPLGSESVPAPVRRLVNLRPVEVSGGSDDVVATAWDASSGGYEVTAVPSMRMVVDLGDLDASTWVQLTGVSGHPGDRHYGDQLDAWREGRTFPWPWSEAAVAASTEDVLRLLPD